MKAYGRPPTLVETVMQAVMILKGCDPSWAEAKRQLGELHFHYLCQDSDEHLQLQLSYLPALKRQLPHNLMLFFVFYFFYMLS